MSSDILRVPEAVRLGRRARRTILVNVVASLAAKAAVLVLALAWRPLLWAAVLADVGTCLLVVLNSMLLLGDGATGRGKEEACRATARSLDMRRSQLAALASNTAAAPATASGDNDCHCCQKQSESDEHTVAIDIPADEHRQEELTCAPTNGQVTGSYPSVVPNSSSCASQGCCSGE
jgi:Cd2+/Zn2+-exporting ATPase